MAAEDLVSYIWRKLLLIFVILLGGFWAYQYFLAPEPLDNAQKALRVTQLYNQCRRGFPETPEVSPAETQQLLKEGRAVLVDVRPEAEWRISRLPGAVRLEEYLLRAREYGDRTAVAYDTVGCRAGQTVQRLKAEGLPLYVLAGGLLGWLHAGGRIVDDRGETKLVHVYETNWNFPPDGYETAW